MRASVRVAWRLAAFAAFGLTAALAVTLNRPASVPAALTTDSARAHPVPASPRCVTSRLEIWVASAPGRAGGVSRYPVEFTNTSGASCTLDGYPEVAAYDGEGNGNAHGGRIVGNAAAPDALPDARQVLLAPGATAHATIAVGTAIASARCRPVHATGLRVIPPGQATARFVPHPVIACSARGPRAPVYLHVRAVRPGMGAT